MSKAALLAVARRKVRSLNPVAELGRELRRADFPKMPGKPPRVDGTVVLPGGKRRRRGPAGDTKNDLP